VDIGSKVSVADRNTSPSGDLEAAVRSGTIEREVDDAQPQQSACRRACFDNDPASIAAISPLALTCCLKVGSRSGSDCVSAGEPLYQAGME
jgi:hypothetical protein